MGTLIELKAGDGHKLSAYRAEPAGKPRGAVVVVQEIFGVNSHIKAVADGFAADGYLAVAPAFFDRVKRGVDLAYTQADIDAGRAVVQQLQWNDTMADVAAAVDNLKSTGKVGIVGYCWGGTVAWVAASRSNGIACAVPYYGGGIAGMIDEKPKVPVMFNWGETDHAIPLDDVKKIEAAHANCISHVYKGAGHGFNCDHRGSYHAESAKIARGRTMEFLRKHLG